MKIDKLVKDFRGVKCPVNFAKTKLVLQGMKNGDILELYIDDGSAIKNLPGSVEKEGHKVLSRVEQEDGSWCITIEKG
ncbi:MAG: sulfurtransferase TusA family protein [Campylobacteraceae bacterium]|nr:sulfurtransferase TusA family protein [Campylobacteraceae bacterium]